MSVNPKFNSGGGFPAAPKSDPVARKLRLRRRRDGQESEKVLKVIKIIMIYFTQRLSNSYVSS